ncbi:DNA polymerase III subunit alpha [Sphingomicrobium nitratireducens]|uniref:DNA polymerase III subunit alpha n=1 Tax=Sphingomicrobium nitratireducens TaxID=2964666 RepID=UPI00223FD444|nr:DNA polymerase III subunit alpha [Sphingomicrobium nitratireducens]
MASAYVPLRVFSSFTMLEGAIEPKRIAELAREMGFPAVGLADRNGLYAAMGFSDACMKAGVQPVVGTMLGVARPDNLGGPAIDWLPLFAQDETGYDNLCKLVSAAHLDRPEGEAPHVPFDLLETASEGLIALTGGGEGAIARLYADGQDDKAKRYAERLGQAFAGRLYVELSRRGDATEETAEAKLVDLAYAKDWPLVATNPTQYDTPAFHAAHDAMLCIAGSTYVENHERKTSSPEAWMKSAADMEALFDDLPEAIANTAVLAQRCAVAAPKRRPILPRMSDDEDAMLRKVAREGLEKRLEGKSDEDKKPYYERLDYEIDIIERMGFSGYFLIVADFIQWAKDNDIPVGPGRGSGAGSAVAWALLITDLDPLELKLLFERFLNPERVSMPDFDIDFCETHRDKVIAYVQRKYGRDKVAQIITFGRLKARAVLKDTGRVLQMSYGQVDRLAKMVPNLPADPWDLKRALNGVPELEREVEGDGDVKRLFDLATKLEGLPRHSSTHAAGVVIGDRPLDQLVPLYRDPRSDMPVTQFDMKHVEQAGLVKFDFLGLKTLSVLKEGQRLLAKRGVEIDYSKLAWDDPAVFELLKRGDTVGVFQLESEGMRRTLAAVRPTNFGDIIALVSLYRPGPMDNIPLFGDRKNGRAEIQYPHDLLKDVLAETYGIFVYQEQVMQAAQVLAGYSLGDADLLRRAMGKKIQAEMDKQRARFVEGCERINQIPAGKANELFDLIDKFAGYGFNKSHAAAYALVAYHTAWLKAHHPAEFYAASMSYDMNLTDKLSLFVEDARRSGIEVAPPDINHARADFDVEDGQVRYALGALKNVGEKAMEQLVAEREANGAFESLDDFAARIDPKLLNRRQLESLAAGGAFDALDADRARVHAGAETILKHAQQAAGERESGQGGLFGGEAVADIAAMRLPDAQWTLAERMTAERDAFGFYFSSHPVDAQKHLLAAHKVRQYADLGALPVPAEGGRSQAMMAALVEEARWRTSQRGRRYMMATLSDPSGQFTAMAFDDDACAALEEAARSGECGLITAELDRKPGEEEPRVTVKLFRPLSALAETQRLMLDLVIAEFAHVEAVAAELRQGGRGTVRARVRLADGREAVLLLGRDFQLDPDIADRLSRVLGEDGVELSSATGPNLRLVS